MLFIGRLGIRACVVLIPLLGVTWLFGALSSTHKAFAYIFVIFNSTQVRCEPPSLRIHHSSIGKLTVGPAVFAIRHLHNSHKAPYLLPFPPSPPPPHKKMRNHFSWVSQPVPREIKNNAYTKFWGTNNVHYGRCASGKDRIKCILPLATIRQSAHEDLPKKFSATEKVMIYYWENKSAFSLWVAPIS